MKTAQLPPLKSLVAFEAAGRHLSFTKAGMELCVTQSAISKQIGLLERYLGKALFVREKRSLVLTEQGQQYFNSVQKSLSGLAKATRDIAGFSTAAPLTILTTGAVASLWLLPRFAEFQKQYPDIDARIKIVSSIHAIGQESFDLGVFHCSEKPQNFKVQVLFEERVLPVCSPTFLREHPEISDPTKISDSRLLVLDTEENWINWSEWLQACDLPATQAHTTQIKINDHSLVLQAAINGQGLALAWEHLVDNYLQDGSLVAASDKSLATASKFYIVTPDSRILSAECESLIEFLV